MGVNHDFEKGSVHPAGFENSNKQYLSLNLFVNKSGPMIIIEDDETISILSRKHSKILNESEGSQHTAVLNCLFKY